MWNLIGRKRKSLSKTSFATRLVTSSKDDNLGSRTRLKNNTDASGIEVWSFSIDSLRQATESLLDMNQDVVQVVLECKNDIWKSRELFDLVGEYFDNSLQMLDFCTSLDRCLKHARVEGHLISVAVEAWEEEEEEGRIINIDKEMLKAFECLGHPVSEELKLIFPNILLHQTTILKKIQLKKAKLDKKQQKIHAWRKVSWAIFATTLVPLLIGSVVAAALAAPPVAAALSAACSVPLCSIGKWIDSLFKKYMDVVKEQKGVISSIEVGIFVGIKDLENIRASLNKLELLQGWNNLAGGEESVGFCLEETKKKLRKFTKNVEKLGMQVDICNREIQRSRNVLLRRLVKHPSLNVEKT